MQSYVLSIISDIKRFSENLDAKAILSNKPWIVFNDAGEKEVYIFKRDGKLRIVLNGRVFDASWEYESANKSIVINGSQERVMVHPAFVDGTILALNIDGTDKYSFLIEEQNAKDFAPKTLEDLNGYFLEVKQRKLERERVLLERRRVIEERRKEAEIRAQKEKEIVTRFLLKAIICILILLILGFVCYYIYQQGVYLCEKRDYGEYYATLHKNYSTVKPLGNDFFIVNNGNADSCIAQNSKVLEGSYFYDSEELGNGDILLRCDYLRGLVNPTSGTFIPVSYDSIISLSDKGLYNVKRREYWKYIDNKGEVKLDSLAEANLLEKEYNVIGTAREEDKYVFKGKVFVINQYGDILKQMSAYLAAKLDSVWEDFYIITSDHRDVHVDFSVPKVTTNRNDVGLYNNKLEVIIPPEFSDLEVKGNRIYCTRGDSVWYFERNASNVVLDKNKTAKNIAQRKQNWINLNKALRECLQDEYRKNRASSSMYVPYNHW